MIAGLLAAVSGVVNAQDAEIRRGAYVASAGGCPTCHTDAADDAVPFAGGRKIETPFGVFYGPNITPHRTAGIGRWTEADFIRAMREGIGPDGTHYYPAFPYPSYTRMSSADLRALWIYLRSRPPNGRANRPHELGLAFGQRSAVGVWKRLYFAPGPFVPDPDASPRVNRGAYLVNALGHCEACHTPRTALGGPRSDRFLAGGRGPDGKEIPNLTPAGLEKFTDEELARLLTSGVTPEGDVLSEDMDLVVRFTTSQLTHEDLASMIAYLRSLRALPAE